MTEAILTPRRIRDAIGRAAPARHAGSGPAVAHGGGFDDRVGSGAGKDCIRRLRRLGGAAVANGGQCLDHANHRAGARRRRSAGTPVPARLPLRGVLQGVFRPPARARARAAGAPSGDLAGVGIHRRSVRHHHHQQSCHRRRRRNRHNPQRQQPGSRRRSSAAIPRRTSPCSRWRPAGPCPRRPGAIPKWRGSATGCSPSATPMVSAAR